MLTSVEQCPLANSAYWKDDTNPMEQLAFTVLFIMSIILTMKNIYNIRIIIAIRKELEIRKLMTINLLLLLMNLSTIRSLF